MLPAQERLPRKSDAQIAKILFTRASDAALSASKKHNRPMVISLSTNRTNLKPKDWAPAISHLWRTGNDIHNKYNGALRNGTPVGMLPNFKRHLQYSAPNSGPGLWNDPDFLFNSTNAKANITTSASAAKIVFASAYHVRDLWLGQTSGNTTGTFGGEIAPHGSLFLRIAVAKRASVGSVR